VITDPHDPRLDPFRGLRATERRLLHPPPAGTSSTPAFVAEGGRVVTRALAAGCSPLALLVDSTARARLTWADDPGLPVLVADRSVIQAATGLAVIRESIGLFARPDLTPPEQLWSAARRVLVLDGVANPANLGTIIRSAAALGVDATLCDPTCADPLYRRAVRGSMGAVLTHPWAWIASIEEGVDALQRAGFTVVALVTDRDACPLASVICGPADRIALVLGSEGDGISDVGRARADLPATIPMATGVDSLNVGAAAAVACALLGALSSRR
jgi:tRNA G18 (ribose-2'-O)-methylase SpoU